MKDFLKELTDYGVKIAIDNWLIGFTKWFIGAKRMKITYFKKSK